MSDIPWDKLGIPDSFRVSIEPSAPRAVQLAAARASIPATTEVTLAALYVLACGPHADVRATALETLKALPGLVAALHQRTHPKVLELIVTTRSEREIDERIGMIRGANDRTATIIAGRADAESCDTLAANHERLLLTPDVIVALHQNPNCSDAALERAVGFLRMQQALPVLPAMRPVGSLPPSPGTAASGTASPGTTRPLPTPRAVTPPQAAAMFDVETEIEAALMGKASPHLVERRKLELFNLDSVKIGTIQGFSFDFKGEDNFSLDVLDDGPESDDVDVKASIEKRIATMSVGKKLKLAYLGNKTARSILIRDRNKMVAVAVVKSGRLTDAEVLMHAGNRNLPDEALREIATNREWTRKYPVKVALVNNPKCPPSVAIGLVTHLQLKDLQSLGRNRNVSSVVFQLASKLGKAKAH